MLALLKLGYSIHDVLDAIEAVQRHKLARLPEPSDTEPIPCIDISRLIQAGEHLARLMCELTRPEN